MSHENNLERNEGVKVLIDFVKKIFSQDMIGISDESLEKYLKEKDWQIVEKKINGQNTVQYVKDNWAYVPKIAGDNSQGYFTRDGWQVRPSDVSIISKLLL